MDISKLVQQLVEFRILPSEAAPERVYRLNMLPHLFLAAFEGSEKKRWATRYREWVAESYLPGHSLPTTLARVLGELEGEIQQHLATCIFYLLDDSEVLGQAMETKYFPCSCERGSRGERQYCGCQCGKVREFTIEAVMVPHLKKCIEKR